MRVTYHEEARAELAEAFSYYESCVSGLGRKFLDETERAMKRVLERPLRWRNVSGRFRRALVKTFPYGIIYRVDEAEIFVAAFMHLHRKPGYWRGRERRQE